MSRSAFIVALRSLIGRCRDGPLPAGETSDTSQIYHPGFVAAFERFTESALSERVPDTRDRL